MQRQFYLAHLRDPKLFLEGLAEGYITGDETKNIDADSGELGELEGFCYERNYSVYGFSSSGVRAVTLKERAQKKRELAGLFSRFRRSGVRMNMRVFWQIRKQNPWRAYELVKNLLMLECSNPNELSNALARFEEFFP
jgi:hypothetical protein